MTHSKEKARLILAAAKPDQSIHLSGIAGSAMRGMAILLVQRGFKVTGTDPQADQVRDFLGEKGITVSAKQDGSEIPKDAVLVVVTAAIPDFHPELAAARSRGLPVIRYAELLGALMEARTGIAVSGTHGKTTTTSMIVCCLRKAGLDPGFVIGGHSIDLGASANNGSSNIFVAEACEYNRSFHNLKPSTAVITNIEEDHLDFYGDLNAIKRSFIEFAGNIRPFGALIFSAHCENTASILDEIPCDKVSFGIDTAADYKAQKLDLQRMSTVFDLVFQGTTVSSVRLRIPGRHNVANALAALAVCRCHGVSFEQIAEALADFRGVKRRFDVHGDFGDVTLMDDYAHHPTEIRSLLEGAYRRFSGRRIVVAFQPHQCSRTANLLEPFAAAFDRADLVIIPDIYSVRETEEDRRRISSKDLVNLLVERGKNAKYSGDLKQTVDLLLTTILKPGDVLITVGAGNVDSILTILKSRL